MEDYFGLKNTQNMIIKKYCWPSMSSKIEEGTKVAWIALKRKGVPGKAPLQLIPASEPRIKLLGMLLGHFLQLQW